MSTPPQLIGARLGAYDIQGLLGSGGMANVYRGFDNNLQRAVAIKVLSLDARTQPGFADRFRQEARLIAAMRAVEPALSDEQHSKVTALLAELAAYTVMEMLHSMTQSRAAQAIR